MTTRTIWKYGLEITSEQSILMPMDSIPLHVGVQGSNLVMWVQVDPTAPTVKRVIRVFGTGQPIPTDVTHWYVGSVQIGFFVWHVYDEGEIFE